jgi:nitrogen fixation protein NifU and related proteins
MNRPANPNELLDMDPLLMDVLLDHYRHPRNRGELPDADIRHQEGNPSCGDQMEIALKTRDGRIEDIRFSGKGCIISQAAASILTDMVKGEPLDRVKGLTKEEMLENLLIPIGPMRLKCALLALKVLKAGVYGQADWPGEEEE